MRPDRLVVFFWGSAIAVVALLLASAVWVWTTGPVVLAAAQVLVALAFVANVWPHRPTSPATGVVVDADAAPALHELLGASADELRIDIHSCWTARQAGRRIVAVALPHMVGLGPAAVRAHVAALQAHDPRPAMRLEQVQAACRRLSAAHWSWDPFQHAFRWFERRATAAAALIEEPAEGSPEVAEAWTAYWNEEAIPALESGVRPALAEGFAAWLGEEASTRDPRLVAEAASVEVDLLRLMAGDARVAALREPDKAPAPKPRPKPAPQTALEREVAAAAARLDAPPVRVRIAASAQTRGFAALALTIVAIGVLPCAFLFFLAASRLDDGVLVSFGFGLGTLIAAAVLTRRYHRAFRESGSLVAADGRLVVEHPSLTAGRLEVPLSLVSAIAIDEVEPDQRFPVRRDSTWVGQDGGTNEAVGFLWSRDAGAALPLLATAPETPNLAVVLREPVGPDRIDGFLLRIAGDPKAITEPLARHGVLHGDVRLGDLPQRS